MTVVLGLCAHDLSRHLGPSLRYILQEMSHGSIASITTGCGPSRRRFPLGQESSQACRLENGAEDLPVSITFMWLKELQLSFCVVRQSSAEKFYVGSGHVWAR